MQSQPDRSADGRRKPGTNRRKQDDRRAGQDRRLEDERRVSRDNGALQVNDEEFPHLKGFKRVAIWERRADNERRGTYQTRGPVRHVITDNEIRFLLESG